MSVSTQPLFPGQVIPKSGLLNTANTARDGSGTMLDIWAGDANGSIVERIGAMSAGAISSPASANVIRAWGKVGSTYRMLAEFPIATATPSATAGGATLPGTTVQSPMLTVNWKLAANEGLSFSIHTVASSVDYFHMRAEVGAYSQS